MPSKTKKGEIVVSRVEALHNEHDIPGERAGERAGAGVRVENGRGEKQSLYQKKMRMMLLESS